ncbi:hypothetical protein AB6A40_001207 [Gnathostoma spinigerum]|uniref:Uncharacterized protein n=1 Tax=Gnathostoma spinigerum TaxID=75299 RepID=A0ABD6E3M8_9BILA
MVRYGWNENLDSAIDYWIRNGASFDAFIATELLSSTEPTTIERLSAVLKADAPLLLLEPFDTDMTDEKIREKLSCLRHVTVADVTAVCQSAILEYIESYNLMEAPIVRQWRFIRAVL